MSNLRSDQSARRGSILCSAASCHSAGVALSRRALPKPFRYPGVASTPSRRSYRARPKTCSTSSSKTCCSNRWTPCRANRSRLSHTGLADVRTPQLAHSAPRRRAERVVRHRPIDGERRSAHRSHDLAAGHVLTSPWHRLSARRRRSGACTLTNQRSRTLVLGALALLAGFDPSTTGRFSGVHRGAWGVRPSTGHELTVP